jgi:hypothetical protein
MTVMVLLIVATATVLEMISALTLILIHTLQTLTAKTPILLSIPAEPKFAIIWMMIVTDVLMITLPENVGYQA